MSLVVSGLTAGYGKLDIIRDVHLTVDDGEIVAVFGRNGAGKTTLAGALLATVRLRSGSVALDGERLDGRSTEDIVAAGLGLVPQSRGLFRQQTVNENLRLACFGARLRRARLNERIDEIYELFPALVKRRDVTAVSISGGEQQMLAIARALVSRPRVLVLDEPSIGLAPRIVSDVAQLVERLRGTGVSFLVAEQNVTWLLPLLSRYYVLDQGRVADEGTAADGPKAMASLVASYLGEVSR